MLSDLLRKSAIDAKRDPEDVHLLAVSKKQPLGKIREAAAAGQRHFGENFVQEGLEKIEALAGLDLTWHLIGHLQSNKTLKVAKSFDWVHTIDRLKTARRLDEQRPADLPPLNICIQVNVDGEASKAGIAPQKLHDLAAACAELPRLRLRGLMCLPAIREGFAAQRAPFAALRQMAEDLRQRGLDIDTLSMGMTGDYRAAIFEGATIVRIGTALFGEREQAGTWTTAK